LASLAYHRQAPLPHPGVNIIKLLPAWFTTVENEASLKADKMHRSVKVGAAASYLAFAVN
jgi:hypothetical protein